ncbi:MAG: hypothetical protein HY695_19385 [Deltaproteobacteria bacterium]|nr:hypothetical protein [Deltaproteobacteria bacterium]
MEKEGLPVAFITAMHGLARTIGANRVVQGTRIPHPCGDPSLPSDDDFRLRKDIVATALKSLETSVDGPTLFAPASAISIG